MRYLAAAYPRSEALSAETVAVYVVQLLRARLPGDVLLLAVMNLIDTSEFVPSVAAIRSEAARIQGEREGWWMTTNYRHHGEALPERLCLPDGMVAEWLGYELPVYSGLLIEEDR